MKPPIFDSVRDYVAALDAAGHLQKFSDVDQDAYEGTAIMYRLVDKFGLRGAPAVRFDNISACGRRYPGPVLANLQGPVESETLLLGIEPRSTSPTEIYRQATEAMVRLLEETGGEWPQLAPRAVSAADAPCKDTVLRGADADLTAYPFLRGNPGDGGPYINTASVFTRDDKLGVNFGTYRCQIKGPRKVMVNFEHGQTGIKMVNAARERGETSIPVALVVGQDPLTWMVSSSRIPSRLGAPGPIDELAVVGGLRGKAVAVVETEDGHFFVPAHAEMVIEGRVDIINLEEEGPYHEMYGYLGHKKDKNFVMQVDTITHRQNPWIVNSFTGVVQEYITAPQRADIIYRLRQSFPSVVDYYAPNDAHGLAYISIRKTAPKQAFEVARPSAMHNPLARVVIVVDDDIDVLDSAAVRFALGSRWQPSTASEIIENRRAFPLDPASPDRTTTSKIIIDATRQWPEEGGPPVYQQLNRSVFEREAADALERIAARWPELA